MFTELEVWNLFWLSGISNAAWFAGLAFLLWVSFSAANLVGESGNMIGIIAVTAFCLVIVYQLNFNAAPVEWAGNGTASALVYLQSQGTEISAGAQRFVEFMEPGKEFELMPNGIGWVFLVTILVMQMSSIWKKK